MISTNKTQPPAGPGPKHGKILTSANLELRPHVFVPREFPRVRKLQTRPGPRGLLMADDLERLARIAKRAACKAALKSARAVAAKPVIEKKKAGRPKKS